MMSERFFSSSRTMDRYLEGAGKEYWTHQLKPY
jgi:hypothetical protein